MSTERLSQLEALLELIRKAKGDSFNETSALNGELYKLDPDGTIFVRPAPASSMDGAISFMKEMLPDWNWVVGEESGCALRGPILAGHKWPSYIEMKCATPALSVCGATLSALIEVGKHA